MNGSGEIGSYVISVGFNTHYKLHVAKGDKIMEGQPKLNLTQNKWDYKY